MPSPSCAEAAPKRSSPRSSTLPADCCRHCTPCNTNSGSSTAALIPELADGVQPLDGRGVRRRQLLSRLPHRASRSGRSCRSAGAEACQSRGRRGRARQGRRARRRRCRGRAGRRVLPRQLCARAVGRRRRPAARPTSTPKSIESIIDRALLAAPVPAPARRPAAVRRDRSVYVPGDSAARSVGADDVAAALAQAADVRLVRNGSRGMLWLEPMIEVATPRRPHRLRPGYVDRRARAARRRHADGWRASVAAGRHRRAAVAAAPAARHVRTRRRHRSGRLPTTTRRTAASPACGRRWRWRPTT